MATQKTVSRPASKTTKTTPAAIVRPVVARPVAKTAAAAVPTAAPSSPTVKPARPGRVAAVPTAAPSSPTVAAPSAPSARETALAAEIATLKTEIGKLTKAAARAKGPTARSAAEILDGSEALIDDGEDWRIPYLGAELWLKPCARKQGNGTIEIQNGPEYRALLAIPRDSDGSYGSEARVKGELAAHFRRDEAGNYLGEPMYLNSDELALIWGERNS